MSDARWPYARIKFGVEGNMDWKSDPSRQAMIWGKPDSAVERRAFERDALRSLYSSGASTFTREKPKLKFARAKVVSLVAEASAACTFLMAVILVAVDGARWRQLNEGESLKTI
jgi:hypothetical protein